MYAQPAFRMENPAEMAAFMAVRRLATPFIAGGLDGFLHFTDHAARQLAAEMTKKV